MEWRPQQVCWLSPKTCWQSQRVQWRLQPVCWQAPRTCWQSQRVEWRLQPVLLAVSDDVLAVALRERRVQQV